MPNKYTYKRLNAAETSLLMKEAGMTSSDAVKLFGRHYSEVQDYLDAGSDRTPTTAEMFWLIFLSEYPEYTSVVLDMANVRITGQKGPRQHV